MPQEGLIYRVFIASPSDCGEERRIAPEVIAEWNAMNSWATGVILEPVMWETHAYPAVGGRPQEIINRQLVTRCDILIGAFWTGLGTPTTEAESGTAEEIEQFRSAGKRVLLYFSSAPVALESLDQAQYQALIAYRDRLAEQSLYSRYETFAQFRQLLARHLGSTMNELLEGRQVSRDLPFPVPAAASPEDVAIQTFAVEFDTFFRTLEATWRAERDSKPHNINEGKAILDRASRELVHLRSRVPPDRDALGEVLDEALRRMRAIQRHLLFLDGGASFREFWTEGDQIINLFQRAPDSIAQGAGSSRPASTRAGLQVRLGRLGSWKHEQIIVTNTGTAEAEDVQLFIDRTPFEDHELSGQKPQGVTRIAPGDEIGYRILVSGQSPDRVEVTVTWRDESGEPGRTRRMLTP
jgi:hypothetical protein